MKKKIKKDIRTSAYLIGIVLVLIVFPQFLRIYSGNTTMIGEEPYYHARLAERILENRIFYKDNMVYGKRELSFTPYHFLLAGTAYIFGIEIASRALPALCGLISAVIFYFLLKRFKLDKFTRIVSLVILASSPVFVYTFSSMQDSLAILFTLLGAYFFFDKRKGFLFLSFASFLLASLFSLFNILLIVIPILIYSFVRKKKQRFSMAVLFALIIICLIKPLPLFYKLVPTSGHIIAELISDTGGIFGIGVFYFILAVIGLIASWKDRKQYYPIYIILILFAGSFCFAGSFAMVYMNFYLSVFAAVGFIRIKEIKWQMKMIKNLTFIIIVCGLLFSMISFSTRLADMPPNSKIVNSLEWLKKNSRESDLTISHYSNGYFIEYLAERPVLFDGYFSSIDDFDHKYLDSYSLFHSVELSQAKDIMNKYGIRYIVVTEDMKEGGVWGRPDEGLLYLFRNNETFKSMYASKEVEIWKYIGQV